ncbi:MAG: beta family protein [Sphingomonas pseudosanguinis]|uniref:beta family protein n=1 Tax=Sphingomonas pseudosanguinis TaxID=413712 RepID=UPI003918B144
MTVYFPGLTIRQSEIEALRRLAEPTKDALFPLIRMQAWPNPKIGKGGPIERSLDHLTEAFGQRNVGLDLAAIPSPPKNDLKTESRKAWSELRRAEMQTLRDPANGYKNWCDLIERDAKWIPVLQWGGDPSTIQSQALRLASFGRGIIIRFRRSQNWNITEAASLTGIPFGDMPVLLVYDYEQISRSDDLTAVGIGVQGAIISTNSLLNGGNRDHVFMASSFPESFKSEGEEYACMQIKERRLHEMLSTSPVIRNAGIDLKYGDHAAVFASDREDAFKGVPRVDYPTKGEWIYHRRREGFHDAAHRVKNDPKWDDENLCWGAQRIREAASGKMEGLNAAPRWTAIRINIHLHVQAHSAGVALGTDEPWTD